MVYLFLSQTILSIPLECIYKISKNNYIIGEHIIGHRISVYITPYNIIVKKKLRAIEIIKGDIFTKQNFDITMEIDFIVNKTWLHIGTENI